MVKKIIVFLLSFLLIFEQSGFAQIAAPLGIPAYLNGFLNPDRFRPMHMRSLSYDALNNNFNILLDKGDIKDLKPAVVQDTTQKLLEYFKIGISLPNSMFWVNLRPDSEKEIIDPNLEKTDLGKVLLEADLQLKKDLANLTSPDNAEGRLYWDKLYARAESMFGRSDIEIPTLTRPWIVPGEIIIRQSPDSAYVYKATLKVMLEQDYLKDAKGYEFDDPRLKELNEFSSDLIRKLIIPKLTRQVNSSKKYSQLRQVYYSLILSQWFKQQFRDKQGEYSGLINKKDLTGLTSKNAWSKDTYFKAYKKSFKNGEYDRQDTFSDVYGGLSIRRYFSGGVIPVANQGEIVTFNQGQNSVVGPDLLGVQIIGNDKFISQDLAQAIADDGTAGTNDGGMEVIRKLPYVMYAGAIINYALTVWYFITGQFGMTVLPAFAGTAALALGIFTHMTFEGYDISESRGIDGSEKDGNTPGKDGGTGKRSMPVKIIKGLRTGLGLMLFSPILGFFMGDNDLTDEELMDDTSDIINRHGYFPEKVSGFIAYIRQFDGLPDDAEIQKELAARDLASPEALLAVRLALEKEMLNAYYYRSDAAKVVSVGIAGTIASWIFAPVLSWFTIPVVLGSTWMTSRFHSRFHKSRRALAVIESMRQATAALPQTSKIAQENKDGGTSQTAGSEELSFLEKLLKPVLVHKYINQLEKGFRAGENAAIQLGRFGNKRAIDPLKKYIMRNLERDQDTYNLVAEQSLRRLGLEDTDVEKIYLQLLDHEVWFVKVHAAVRLGQIGGENSKLTLDIKAESLARKIYKTNEKMDIHVQRIFRAASKEIEDRGAAKDGGKQTEAERETRLLMRLGLLKEKMKDPAEFQIIAPKAGTEMRVIDADDIVIVFDPDSHAGNTIYLIRDNGVYFAVTGNGKIEQIFIHKVIGRNYPLLPTGQAGKVEVRVSRAEFVNLKIGQTKCGIHILVPQNKDITLFDKQTGQFMPLVAAKDGGIVEKVRHPVQNVRLWVRLLFSGIEIKEILMTMAHLENIPEPKQEQFRKTYFETVGALNKAGVAKFHLQAILDYIQKTTREYSIDEQLDFMRKIVLMQPLLDTAGVKRGYRSGSGSQMDIFYKLVYHDNRKEMAEVLTDILPALTGIPDSEDFVSESVYQLVKWGRPEEVVKSQNIRENQEKLKKVAAFLAEKSPGDPLAYEIQAVVFIRMLQAPFALDAVLKLIDVAKENKSDRGWVKGIIINNLLYWTVDKYNPFAKQVIENLALKPREDNFRLVSRIYEEYKPLYEDPARESFRRSDLWSLCCFLLPRNAAAEAQVKLEGGTVEEQVKKFVADVGKALAFRPKATGQILKKYSLDSSSGLSAARAGLTKATRTESIKRGIGVILIATNFIISLLVPGWLLPGLVPSLLGVVLVFDASFKLGNYQDAEQFIEQDSISSTSEKQDGGTDSNQLAGKFSAIAGTINVLVALLTTMVTTPPSLIAGYSMFLWSLTAIVSLVAGSRTDLNKSITPAIPAIAMAGSAVLFTMFTMPPSLLAITAMLNWIVAVGNFFLYGRFTKDSGVEHKAIESGTGQDGGRENLGDPSEHHRIFNSIVERYKGSDSQIELSEQEINAIAWAEFKRDDADIQKAIKELNYINRISTATIEKLNERMAFVATENPFNSINRILERSPSSRDGGISLKINEEARQKIQDFIKEWPNENIKGIAIVAINPKDAKARKIGYVLIKEKGNSFIANEEEDKEFAEAFSNAKLLKTVMPVQTHVSLILDSSLDHQGNFWHVIKTFFVKRERGKAAGEFGLSSGNQAQFADWVLLLRNPDYESTLNQKILWTITLIEQSRILGDRSENQSYVKELLKQAIKRSRDEFGSKLDFNANWMRSLSLREYDLNVFNQFVEKCRNPGFTLSPEAIKILQSRPYKSLIEEDGTISERTRNTVLSLVTINKWDNSINPPDAAAQLSQEAKTVEEDITRIFDKTIKAEDNLRNSLRDLSAADSSSNAAEKTAVAENLLAYGKKWNEINKAGTGDLVALGKKWGAPAVVSALKRGIDAQTQIRMMAYIEPAIAQLIIGDFKAGTESQAFGKLDVPRLVELLSSRNSVVRWGAFIELKRLNELTEERKLIRFVTDLIDPDEEARNAAAKELPRIKVPNAVKILLKRLNNQDDEYIRSAAAVALGIIGDPTAVEGLIYALSDPYINVRLAVIYALGNIDDPRAIEALQRALFDDNNEIEIKDAADAAIEKISEKRANENKKDGGDFRIGQTNSDEAILKLTQINGIPISKIEQMARPGQSSKSGFLDYTESLIDRLLKDNQLVRQLGYTHQQLAEPLMQIMNQVRGGRDSETVTYNGQKYEVSVKIYRGWQSSIFSDDISGSADYTVKNLSTGKKLVFAELVPHYVLRYGFYEGNVEYRVDPRDIVEMFLSSQDGGEVTVDDFEDFVNNKNGLKKEFFESRYLKKSENKEKEDSTIKLFDFGMALVLRTFKDAKSTDISKIKSPADREYARMVRDFLIDEKNKEAVFAKHVRDGGTEQEARLLMRLGLLKVKMKLPAEFRILAPKLGSEMRVTDAEDIVIVFDPDTQAENNIYLIRDKGVYFMLTDDGKSEQIVFSKEMGRNYPLLPLGQEGKVDIKVLLGEFVFLKIGQAKCGIQILVPKNKNIAMLDRKTAQWLPVDDVARDGGGFEEKMYKVLEEATEGKKGIEDIERIDPAFDARGGYGSVIRDGVVRQLSALADSEKVTDDELKSLINKSPRGLKVCLETVDKWRQLNKWWDAALRGDKASYQELQKRALADQQAMIKYFEAQAPEAIAAMSKDIFGIMDDGEGYGYDVRGNALEVKDATVNLKPVTAYLFGKGLATLRAQEGDTGLITGDQRWHTPALRLAMALGSSAAGVNIDFSNEVFGTGEHGVLSGENPFNHKFMVQVSGSHGIPEKNGLKIKVDEEGRLEPLYVNDLAEVYFKSIVKNAFRVPAAYGTIREVSGLTELVVGYLDKTLPGTDPEQPTVLDGRNSALIPVLKKLMVKRGMNNVRWFNDIPDPAMPGGIWDPSKKEALVLSSQKVKEWNRELEEQGSKYRAVGFVFDGDGDRATAIIEDGSDIPPFEMTLPFYQRFISDPVNQRVVARLRETDPGYKIWLVCDIRATSTLTRMIDRYPAYAGYYLQPGYPPQRDFVRWRIEEMRKFIDNNPELKNDSQLQEDFQHFANTYFTAEASGHQFFHICPTYPEKVIDSGIAVMFNLLHIKQTLSKVEAQDEKLNMPAKDEYSLVDLFKAFPPAISSEEVRNSVPNSVKWQLSNDMTRVMKEHYADRLLPSPRGVFKVRRMLLQAKEEGAIAVDGLKIQLKDGSSALFRKSNTGEQTTLMFEGSTAEALIALMKEIEQLTRQTMKEMEKGAAPEMIRAIEKVNLADQQAKTESARKKYGVGKDGGRGVMPLREAVMAHLRDPQPGMIYYAVVSDKNSDTDTVASAIAEAYRISQASTNVFAFPIIQGELNDETLFVLKASGIDPEEFVRWENEADKLLAGMAGQKEYELRYVLTDHSNALKTTDGIAIKKPTVIDHHEAPAIESAEDSVVRRAGATAVLILDRFGDLREEMPETIAKLLLSAILSDTKNLAVNTQDEDRKAAELLIQRLGMSDESASKFFVDQTNALNSLLVERPMKKIFSADNLRYYEEAGGKGYSFTTFRLNHDEVGMFAADLLPQVLRLISVDLIRRKLEAAFFNLTYLNKEAGIDKEKSEELYIAGTEEKVKLYLTAAGIDDQGKLENVLKVTGGVSVFRLLHQGRAARKQAVKSISAYFSAKAGVQNGPSSSLDGGQETAEGDKTMPATEKGGIDFRALPVGGTAPNIAPVLTPLPAGYISASSEEMDRKWQDIKQKIQAGPMPYQQIKEYVSVCCQRTDATDRLKQASAYILNLLRLEEDAAVATAPELKEILSCLS